MPVAFPSQASMSLLGEQKQRDIALNSFSLGLGSSRSGSLQFFPGTPATGLSLQFQHLQDQSGAPVALDFLSFIFTYGRLTMP
jgi:hypothetical protein